MKTEHTVKVRLVGEYTFFNIDVEDINDGDEIKRAILNQMTPGDLTYSIGGPSDLEIVPSTEVPRAQ